MTIEAQPSALWEEGVALLAAGRLPAAEAALGKAIRGTPPDGANGLRRASMLQVLGKVRVMSGRSQGARATFDASFQLLADHAFRSCGGPVDARRTADGYLSAAVGLSVSLAMSDPTPAVVETALRQVWVRKVLTAALRRKESPLFGPAFPSLADVRRGLSADSLLLEVARFYPYDLFAPLNQAHPLPARYVAFAVPGWARTVAPLLIDVGSAADIEDIIAGVREELSGEPSYAGGNVTLTAADAHRLLQAGDTAPGSGPRAPGRVTYLRSHQRVDRALTVDEKTLRDLLAHLEHGGQGLSLDDLHMGPESRSFSRDLASGAAEADSQPDRGSGNARELGRLLLNPLAVRLSRVRHIIVAPDGELWLLPFAALQDATGTPLLARADVTVTEHAFDLASSPGAAAAATQPLVIADPAFRKGPPTTTEPSFAQLPGARDEGVAVAALLGTPCYTGDEATDVLVRQARSPRVLHLATHGFALPDRRPGGIEWVGSEGLHGFALLANANDPDLRAGLALAGAADWAAHGERLPEPGDGLLLASDIAELNLEGTALVVLSACETGMGQVAAGDATWSLARSFRKAGARVVVMSLWRVSDQSTRSLMEIFYRRFLNGDPPAQALRHAQLTVMATGASPRHWAPFTCWGFEPQNR
jgi:CHAT domain-containing protein